MITAKQKQFSVAAIKIDNIIDSTGSGDTFAAGFLFGLIKNKSLEWSADFGIKIASLSLTDFGLKWLEQLNTSKLS